MESRPTGTVSFLFTDVAGSTRLWDSDREGMAASLAAHDRILLGAIADHAGYVFSTAGDSFGAAFATAAAAVAAAVQAQLQLATEPWAGPAIRVRMGLHTGASEERAGNYFGPEVNRAARVMSAANGGQVLMSGVTADLVASETAGEFVLADRGTHALKDLDRPEHLFELRHPDLPEVREPLHTLDVERLHLPPQLTTFVGRRVELEAVTSLLGSSRLVTLTGVGGTGKTRLSIEAAAVMEAEFPDGVWMVELAPVADPDLVVTEVAQLWGLRPGEGVPLIQVVRAHLAARRLLLVIDNCEHVLGAAAALVIQVLAAGSGVSVLATSRESLGVPGESVYRVPSLGLPTAEGEAVDSDAVRLFLDRAGHVKPGFSAAGEDLEAVVRVCRRLDGIPLGIELAAARLRLLTPRELADRLDDSFRILTGGSKTAVPRQRTLQTAIDWSYDLLEPAEASLFRRVAAFAGGFDLAAAEVVGAGDGVEGWEVLDLLDQLVDKSLVSSVQDDAGTRFRLLEPIRQYAQERLAQAGEAEAVRVGHARYYADLVSAIAPNLRGGDQLQANRDLLAELDNIRTALLTLDEAGMADRFFELCFDLIWFWAHSSLQVEGRELVLGGLRRLGDAASPAVVARAWLAASMLAVLLTDPNGVEYADRALDAARSTGDDSLIGWMALLRGVAQANVGAPDPNNERWFDEARERRSAGSGRPMWDPEWDQAVWSFMLAFGKSGSADERRRHLIDATERAQRLGDGYLAANAMTSASYLVDDADPEWKVSMLKESVEVLRRLDFRHGLGHSLFYLGLAQADGGGGLAELEEASRLLAEVGDLPCSTWSAARLIRSLLDAGDQEAASRELVAVARRLLSFERDVDAEIAGLACRLALQMEDAEEAARFLGHAEAHEHASRPSDVEECRRQIESSLPAGEIARLTTAGAAAGRGQIIERILDWKAS